MRNLMIMAALLLTMSSCKSVVTVLNSTKQEIIAGRASVANKVNYVFELKNNTDKNLKIKHLLVKNNGVFYELKFDIMNEGQTVVLERFDAGATIKLVGVYREGRSVKTGENFEGAVAVIQLVAGEKTKNILIKSITELKPQTHR